MVYTIECRSICLILFVCCAHRWRENRQMIKKDTHMHRIKELVVAVASAACNGSRMHIAAVYMCSSGRDNGSWLLFEWRQTPNEKYYTLQHIVHGMHNAHIYSGEKENESEREKQKKKERRRRRR